MSAMLPMLMLATVIPQAGVHVQCGNPKQARTPMVRNASGYAVSLLYQDDDDHNKGVHNCNSEYELEIVKPDGSRIETGWDVNNDANWDRPIAFRVEGFTRDGKRSVTLVNESSGRWPMVEVTAFDLMGGRYQIFDLDPEELRWLGGACIASLRVTGVTRPGGELVVESERQGGCNKEVRWRVTSHTTRRGHNIVKTVPATAGVEPLDRGH